MKNSIFGYQNSLSLNKWRYSGWFVRKMWFFKTRNYFGQKIGPMAIFRVVCQKHVVFPNSILFLAQIWTNGFRRKKHDHFSVTDGNFERNDGLEMNNQSEYLNEKNQNK